MISSSSLLNGLAVGGEAVLKLACAGSCKLGKLLICSHVCIQEEGMQTLHPTCLKASCTPHTNAARGVAINPTGDTAATVYATSTSTRVLLHDLSVE
jgi:hypothetical protein